MNSFDIKTDRKAILAIDNNIRELKKLLQQKERELSELKKLISIITAHIMAAISAEARIAPRSLQRIITICWCVMSVEKKQ